MARTPSKKVLANFLAKHAERKPDGSVNVTKLGKDLGDGGSQNTGTAQRALAGQTSVGLDVLDRLAQKFNVEPWQLIRPAEAAGSAFKIAEPAAPAYLAAVPRDGDDARQKMTVSLVDLFWTMSEAHRDDIMLLCNRWANQDKPGPASPRDPIRPKGAKVKA